MLTTLLKPKLLSIGLLPQDSEFEAKQLIGQFVAVEIFSVLKEQKPFNEARYIKNLDQLPKEPFNEP